MRARLVLTWDDSFAGFDLPRAFRFATGGPYFQPFDGTGCVTGGRLKMLVIPCPEASWT
jgi:hypothetical protein